MNIPKNKNTKKKKTRVVLNISGEIFETHESTLARFPTSLLGNKPARLQYFHSDHYFFERNRVCFEAILHFYQSNGTLNCPMVRAPNFWSPFFTPHNFSSPVFWHPFRPQKNILGFLYFYYLTFLGALSLRE